MIKNYTTKVSAIRTLSEIENLLIKMGASGISKKYKKGKVDSVVFTVSIENQGEFSFALPAKTDSLINILRDCVGNKSKKIEWLRDQAERVAWRIVLNWVEVQCAMIEVGQAEAMEVFLPYLLTKNGKTVYEKFLDHGIANSANLLGMGK